jgi:peptidyl-prolyl cis-trans isomerase SurA
MLKFKLLLTVLLLLLGTLPATARTISRIAAVVNSDIITSYELDKAVNTEKLAMSDSSTLSEEQLASLKKSTLDRLINNKLFEQRITELDLSASDEDIDIAFENVQKQNNMTREQLIQAVTTQGMSLDGYRERLKQEILNYKLMSIDVYSKVLITSTDIRQYFEENLENYQNSAALDLNHLTIELNDTNRQEAQEQLESARRQILNGVDFAELLSELQEDGISGGPMTGMRESDLAEPIREQLKDLQIGDISEPFELGGQLHLFQLSSRETDKESLFEIVKSDIEKTLKNQNSESRLEEWHKELRENADIDIRP